VFFFLPVNLEKVPVNSQNVAVNLESAGELFFQKVPANLESARELFYEKVPVNVSTLPVNIKILSGCWGAMFVW